MAVGSWALGTRPEDRRNRERRRQEDSINKANNKVWEAIWDEKLETLKAEHAAKGSPPFPGSKADRRRAASESQHHTTPLQSPI